MKTIMKLKIARKEEITRFNVYIVPFFRKEINYNQKSDESIYHIKVDKKSRLSHMLNQFHTMLCSEVF